MVMDMCTNFKAISLDIYANWLDIKKGNLQLKTLQFSLTFNHPPI